MLLCGLEDRRRRSPCPLAPPRGFQDTEDHIRSAEGYHMAVKERRSRSDCASARLCALEDTAVRKFARRFLRRATPLRSRRQHWDCRSVRREPQHWVSSIPRGLSSSPSGRTRCVAHRSVRAHWTLSTGSGRARIFGDWVVVPHVPLWRFCFRTVAAKLRRRRGHSRRESRHKLQGVVGDCQMH